MKKIAIITSGGDAPGMNAAIRALVRCSISNDIKPFGIFGGYEGLLDGNMKELTSENVGGILHTGGTVLGTSRSERFRADEWIDHAANYLHSENIDCVVIIGGDGSFKGGIKLAKRGIQVIGIPSTIDNDIGYTDFSIGFDTAVNTIINLISNVRDTSSAHERTTIVEVMGRDCGDIALHAGIAGGADVILVPEKRMPIEEIVKRVRAGQSSGKKHSIIVMAEGCEYPINELADLLQSLSKRETRSVIPGYIQRGGSHSAFDRILASRCGAEAISIITSGCTESLAVGVKQGEIFQMRLDQTDTKKHFDENLYLLSDVLS